MSRRTLILAAEQVEIEPLLSHPNWADASENATCRLTRVGKINAALTAAQAIDEERPDRIVQIGCAGAYPGSGLDIGDVAIASEEILADEGVATTEGFLDLSDLGLHLREEDGRTWTHRLPVSCPDELRLAEVRKMCGDEFSLIRGPLITVSTGAGNRELAREREMRWSPLAESMEGAAVAYVCSIRGLPFLEVRGISNRVGPRDRGSWRIELACERAARVLMLLDWIS